VRAALPEMLSPQHLGITVESVSCSDDAERGYILFSVPASSNRPHMSLSEQRYFRRGSDGTRVLVHGEVRDLMFVSKEGALEMRYNLRRGVSQGRTKFQLSIRLNVCNVGQIPVVAPFLRLSGVGFTIPESLQPRSMRNTSNGFMGVYTTRDVVLHLDDEITVAEIGTGLDFTRLNLGNELAAIAAIKDGCDDYSMIPWTSMPQGHQALTPADVPIAGTGLIGGENAPAKKFDFRLGKIELLELFAQDLTGRR
jgi:hypothetical protein